MSGEMVEPLKWYTKEPTSKHVRIFFCINAMQEKVNIEHLDIEAPMPFRGVNMKMSAETV